MNPIFFSGLLLVAIVYIAFRIAPREKQESAHIHGAGQIGWRYIGWGDLLRASEVAHSPEREDGQDRCNRGSADEHR